VDPGWMEHERPRESDNRGGGEAHRDRDFAGAFPSRQKRLAGMGPLVVAAGAVEHGNGEEQRPTGATGSG
jgi:hypothetical protein